MFTGLSEETGTLQSIQRGAASCVLTIGCRTVLEGSKVGDSIMVNGVCLTATDVGSTYFTADAMPETLDRSALGSLHPGSRVHLERTMPANGRFGGHIVSGHIDGTGTITRLREDGNAVWVTVAAGPELLRYIVEKGSVAIDGISLTVAAVTGTDFSVSLIPHTRRVTAFSEKGPGDTVNLECDILGKYVEKLMGFGGEKAESPKETSESFTMEFLREHGF